MITGKVLITGGTGSLGTAIIQRAKDEGWDAEFTTVSRNETKIWQMKSKFPDVNCLVGDCKDLEDMKRVVRGHDIVIHAGALKIVPLAESRVREAVSCNITGTANMTIACADAGVKKMLLISSDKACGPTYYGVTKRLGEGLVRESASWGSKTVFSSCRYGNVLRSANSIVPFFERLIAEDKPFTITDFKMNRFWLSMRQAVDIVITSLNENKGGEIYVPKAPALPITSLARYMDPDREQIEIGIRPGERLDETLIVQEEACYTTEHSKHFVVKPPAPENLGNLHHTFEYTSEYPSSVLTEADFKKLMRDS